MMNTGLTLEQAATFYGLLRGPHRVYNQIHFLDNALNFVSEPTSQLSAGVVDMDSTADITRSAKLVFADPTHSIGLDSAQSWQGTNFYGRQVRVYQTIQSLDRVSQFVYPLFTGPITDVQRDGVMLNVECQGKEVLAKNGAFNAWTWPMGWQKAGVIENAMRVFAGEIHFDLDPAPNFTTLQQNWSIEAGEDMWARVKEMAYGMGMHLFYNAWGVLRMRPRPYSPVWTWDQSFMTTQADIKFDIDNLVNAVRAKGGTPPGTEGAYMYEALPPASHPFSPQSLAINGQPRYMPEFIDDDSLLSANDVATAAWQTLQDRILQAIDINFTSVVIPHLEEDDMYFVNSDKYYGTARLTKQTIDLTSAEMSVGFLSTTSVGRGINMSTGTTRLTGVAQQIAAKKHPLADKKTGAQYSTIGGIDIKKKKPKKKNKDNKNNRGKNK